MLSSAITSVNGSSKVFTMGLVTYSDQAKTDVLKVPKKIIKRIWCCKCSMLFGYGKQPKQN